MTIILWHEEVFGIIIEMKQLMMRMKMIMQITSKFFECKTKIIERTSGHDNTLDAKAVVPFK